MALDHKLPALSVLLPTADDFQTIRRTVRALSRQTIRDQIELVIISPVDDPGVIEEEVAGFFAVQTLNGGPLRSSNTYRVAGIRKATAPVVVMGEDHCFPSPEWAAALVEAHREDFAVVGPVLINGNPRSMVSWANILLEYSQWLEGAQRRETDTLPGHNSSYKRDLLLAYGDHLEEIFEIEDVVHSDFRNKGYRMLIEPAARTTHFNFSRIAPAMKLRFNAGRSFAGHRTMGWTAAKRATYIVGAPLIPLVRLTRVVKMLRSSANYGWLFPRILPLLSLVLIIDGFGELVGYVSGPGRAALALGGIEFNRARFMNAEDRKDYLHEFAQLESPGELRPLELETAAG